MNPTGGGCGDLGGHLFIITGPAFTVYWGIKLAMCFQEAVLLKIRCSNPFLKN
jgi:hypothetical protein